MTDFLFAPYKNASLLQIILEALTFIFGITSVYFAKKENIWVYPTGLIATVITVYLMYKAAYFGDMTINFYFSVMSIYGWYKWSKKTTGNQALPISSTNFKEKIIGILLFLITIIIIFIIYSIFDYDIRFINYCDIFTSGLFFTAMWYMALKKIENWTLWIIGNCITVPLYWYKGLGILALEYVIFTILAVLAYIEWKKILRNNL
ncbi:MAG TPA: nicotinamide riboside transporter PnuC [Flavobacterium sp.]|jgi:nicotinamide mononucleotide transporter